MELELEEKRLPRSIKNSPYVAAQSCDSSLYAATFFRRGRGGNLVFLGGDGGSNGGVVVAANETHEREIGY